MTTAKTDSLARLREPFPPEAVRTIVRGGVELPYVGHAWVTERLLEVDPGWWWEPMCVDERGLPLILEHGPDFELWIRLHVCGICRIGVGSVPKNVRGDISKQLVSDAIRNAAMRFGVALDLWKGVSEESTDGPAQPVNPPSRPATPPAQPATPPVSTPELAEPPVSVNLRRMAKQLLLEAVGDPAAAKQIWDVEGFDRLRADRLMDAVEPVIAEIQTVGVEAYLQSYEPM